MLYTILCYNCEETTGSWTKEQDDAVMGKHREPFMLTDGPYAETKEQILGFYVIDCESEDEAIEIARELGHANPGGAFEIRPMTYFHPNDQLAGAATMPNATA